MHDLLYKIGRNCKKCLDHNTGALSRARIKYISWQFFTWSNTVSRGDVIVQFQPVLWVAWQAGVKNGVIVVVDIENVITIFHQTLTGVVWSLRPRQQTIARAARTELPETRNGNDYILSITMRERGGGSWPSVVKKDEDDNDERNSDGKTHPQCCERFVRMWRIWVGWSSHG